MIRPLLFLVAAALASSPVQAAPKPQPAAPKAVKNPDEPVDSVGTTIIGDQESPIGLYITPWKDEYAERGLDRPARLLDEALLPIDPASFRRQIDYANTLAKHRRDQQAAGK